MPINNDVDFRRTAQLLRDGAIPEDMQDAVMKELRDYDAVREQKVRTSHTREAQFQQHDPDRPWYEHDAEGVKQVKDLSLYDWAEGVYDMAMAGATSIVSVPTSGLAGAAVGAAAKGLGVDGQTALNAAASTQKFLQDLLTNDPEGEAMKTFGAVVGPTVAQATEAIDDKLYDWANGDPELAATYKTLVYGIPSAVGMGRMRIPKRIATDIKNFRTGRRIAKETEEAGYTLDTEQLPGRVKAKAHDMVPDAEKGTGWGEVIDELRVARNKSKEEVDSAYDAARATQAFIEIAPLRHAAKRVGQDLSARYNVVDMPQLQTHIRDMRRLASRVGHTGRKLPKRRTELDLNEVDLLRQRISNDISGSAARGFSPQDRALMRLRSELDSVVDDMWQRGAISGDPGAKAAWQKARGLAEQHHRRFKADRVIRDMLVDGATPEYAYNLVIGSSAMGAKKQASMVVRRMKEILGESHPAIVNMRKAVIRDVVLPALSNDKANFGLLGVNIDKLLRNHPALVKELGIDIAELRKLRRASHVANETVRMAPEKFGAEYVNSVLASVAFGHGIARKGAFVRTVRKVLNRWTGVGLMSKSDIRRHLLEAEYDTPIRDMSGPSVPVWLAMTQGAELGQTDEEQQVSSAEAQARAEGW